MDYLIVWTFSVLSRPHVLDYNVSVDSGKALNLIMYTVVCVCSFGADVSNETIVTAVNNVKEYLQEQNCNI